MHSLNRKMHPKSWWTILILPALFLLFPVGLLLMEAEQVIGFENVWTWCISVLAQAGFAWVMCFGMIGLFRWIASKKRAWVLYMSDASYWIYLCHLPLVLILQMLIADWPINPHLKYVLVCVMTSVILVIVYQLAIRYSIVGTMLNGKRVRPAAGV